MNELIKVYQDNCERPTVSARELHEFLDVDTEYRHWFPRMCEYGFIEGIDFRSFLNESTGGRPASDAQLTIDMAKEISMLQRNEKGKQARQYFIQLEKYWNSPEKIMERALQIAKEQVKELESKLKEDEPRVVFAKAVETAHTSILIGDLAKILCQNGLDMGQKRLFQWMRGNGYLVKSGESRNMPTQRAMKMGLFEIKERTIANGDGSVRVTRTTKVTGRGQQYFVNKLLKESA